MRWSHTSDGLIALAIILCVVCSANVLIMAEEAKTREHEQHDFSLPAQLDKYGIAAVAAILLMAMWRTQERMSRSLETHEKILVELVREAATAGEKQAAAMAILCREMRNRPCLRDIDEK